MKYRIVRNGLGEYAVQEQFGPFWRFIKAAQVQHLGSEYAPATWDTAEKAQEWLDRHLASKKSINEWNNKRNTWEVVG